MILLQIFQSWYWLDVENTPYSTKDASCTWDLPEKYINQEGDFRLVYMGSNTSLQPNSKIQIQTTIMHHPEDKCIWDM